uniref:Uncharacterized protein n=1 Tax=Octopus bimaculoides TaxID=37653 RepID=A0A0L8FIN2_OCTBM
MYICFFFITFLSLIIFTISFSLLPMCYLILFHSLYIYIYLSLPLSMYIYFFLILFSSNPFHHFFFSSALSPFLTLSKDIGVLLSHIYGLFLFSS